MNAPNCLQAYQMACLHSIERGAHWQRLKVASTAFLQDRPISVLSLPAPFSGFEFDMMSKAYFSLFLSHHIHTPHKLKVIC
jgi:hypothetical protein